MHGDAVTSDGKMKTRCWVAAGRSLQRSDRRRHCNLMNQKLGQQNLATTNEPRKTSATFNNRRRTTDRNHLGTDGRPPVDAFNRPNHGMLGENEEDREEDPGTAEEDVSAELLDLALAEEKMATGHGEDGHRNLQPPPAMEETTPSATGSTSLGTSSEEGMLGEDRGSGGGEANEDEEGMLG